MKCRSGRLLAGVEKVANLEAVYVACRVASSLCIGCLWCRVWSSQVLLSEPVLAACTTRQSGGSSVWLEALLVKGSAHDASVLSPSLLSWLHCSIARFWDAGGLKEWTRCEDLLPC